MIDLDLAWRFCAGLLAVAAGLRGVENTLRNLGRGVSRTLAVLSLLLALTAGVQAIAGELQAWPWWFLCGLGCAESVRAGGLEQGGSDPMTSWMRLLVALSATLASAYRPALTAVAVALLLASYFCAGLAKARHRSWWRGEALAAYLAHPAYRQSASLAARIPRGALTLAAWLVLAFELLAPCVLFDADLLLAWCGLGVLFHLGNIFCFGLHRFFWVWVSIYPLLFALVGNG